MSIVTNSIKTSQKFCKNCGIKSDNDDGEASNNRSEISDRGTIILTECMHVQDSAKIVSIQKIRKSSLYIFIWALMLTSAFAGLFLDPIPSVCVALVFGVIGFYISPFAEKTIEYVREI
jgi:hypothetical protein